MEEAISFNDRCVFCFTYRKTKLYRKLWVCVKYCFRKRKTLYRI